MRIGMCGMSDVGEGASIVDLERRTPGQKLGHLGLDHLRQEIAPHGTGLW